MRFTIVLCITLVASVSGGFFEDRIHDIYKNIDGGIAIAIDKAQEVVDVTKARANGLGNNVVKAVNEHSDKISARVEEFFRKFGEKFEEIIGKRKNNTNVAECKKLAESLHGSVVKVSTETSHCLMEKIPIALKYVDEIADTSSTILNELRQSRIEARKCVSNSVGFDNAGDIIGCLTKAGAAASWVSVKKLPKISTTLGKLGFHVSTLPVTLPFCAVSTGFNDVLEGAKGAFEHIEKCYKGLSAKPSP